MSKELKAAFEAQRKIHAAQENIYDKQFDAMESGAVPMNDVAREIRRIPLTDAEDVSDAKLRGYKKRRDARRALSRELGKRKAHTPLTSAQESREG